MRYKRNEAFRYEFGSPIAATFKIIEINGVPTETKEDQAKIKDISPHGLRLLSKLNIQLKRINSVKAEIHIFLDSTQPLIVNGSFVWQRPEAQGYSYGIEIESTTEIERLIVQELKKFSKEKGKL